VIQAIDTLCVQSLKSSSDIYAVWLCGQHNPPSNPFCHRAYIPIEKFLARFPDYGSAVNTAIMSLPTRRYKPFDFIKVEYEGIASKWS
jgi:hypothetical protein